MEQYYYNHMDKQKQAAYHAMLQGIRNLTDEFQIPALDADSLYNVFFQLRLDHPEIFWATGYKYRYYKDSPNIIFIPEYLFEKNKIREHQKAMTARTDKLVRTAAKLSEWEKEKYVHDFICENIRYDKLKKPYSHEIIGPLGQGVGVCEGIAKAVKALLDELGVWCARNSSFVSDGSASLNATCPLIPIPPKQISTPPSFSISSGTYSG